MHELIASGAKVSLIARKLKRSPGAISARMTSFRKALCDPKFGVQRPSLPSKRLAVAHENAQSVGGQGRLVELGLKAKK
jgi:hypothetical protein